MLNTKALQLVTKGTTKFRAIVASEPFRQPIAHKSRIVEGTSNCERLLVREERKLSCFREMIDNDCNIHRPSGLSRECSARGAVLLAARRCGNSTQLKGTSKVDVHMLKGARHAR